MRLLVHVCCGPCLYALLPSLREERHAVAAFFYNPNIHPYREFRKRARAAQLAAEIEHIPMTLVEEYGLVEFLRNVVGKENERCPICYRMRLARAARAAAEGGMDAYTTTLLASPHQDLSVIRAAGEEAAERAGISFYYRDWRGDHERDRGGAPALPLPAVILRVCLQRVRQVQMRNRA